MMMESTPPTPVEAFTTTIVGEDTLPSSSNNSVEIVDHQQDPEQALPLEDYEQSNKNEGCCYSCCYTYCCCCWCWYLCPSFLQKKLGGGGSWLTEKWTFGLISFFTVVTIVGLILCIDPTVLGIEDPLEAAALEAAIAHNEFLQRQQINTAYYHQQRMTLISLWRRRQSSSSSSNSSSSANEVIVDIFGYPNSPQQLAMKWLAFEDTMHLPLPDTIGTNTTNTNITDADDEDIIMMIPSFRWIQRFVLMTIFFANDGDTWARFISSVGTNSTDLTTTTINVPEDEETPEIMAMMNSTTTKSSWSNQIGIDVCDWELTDCDDDGRLTFLDLGGRGGSSVSLSDLPKEIGWLTSLTFLDLSENQIKGSVPKELFDLYQLEVLDLSDNKLTYEIDSRIGNLYNMTVLNLAHNKFMGTMPSSFTKLTKLREFYINHNEFLHGPILSYAGIHWTELETLDISQSLSSGTIPTQIGALSHLKSLAMGSVEMGGTIPSEIGLLVNLELFDMNNAGHNITGDIPPEFAALNKMEVFDISHNKLGGYLPTELGLWSNCLAFNIEASSIIGTIPTQMGLMKNLEILFLSAADLTGSIPSELGQLTNGNRFEFWRNQLRGTMPQEICDIDSVTRITADCQSPGGIYPAKVVCSCCGECAE